MCFANGATVLGWCFLVFQAFLMFDHRHGMMMMMMMMMIMIMIMITNHSRLFDVLKQPQAMAIDC